MINVMVYRKSRLINLSAGISSFYGSSLTQKIRITSEFIVFTAYEHWIEYLSGFID